MKRKDFLYLHGLYLKGVVMESYRYCEKVYNGGIDSYEQFQTFINLCQNFVNICNFYSKNIKPTLGLLQTNKWAAYKDFQYVCTFAVDKLNDMIRSWQASYDKSLEECEMIKQMETRARIDHEIAIEYREKELEKQKNQLKTRPIGYNINKATTDEQENAVILPN